MWKRYLVGRLNRRQGSFMTLLPYCVDADLLFTSPLPRFLLGGGLPTYPHDRYCGQLPAKVPLMLVLQGTLDPKTPYADAQAQVDALTKATAGKVTLATVKNAPHFILWTAPACFEQAPEVYCGQGDAGLCVEERYNSNFLDSRLLIDVIGWTAFALLC